MAIFRSGLARGVAAGVLVFAVGLAACGDPQEDTTVRKVTVPPELERQAMAEITDPHDWLEDIDGEAALEWVRARNEVALARLKADPRFERFRDAAEEVLTADDRIPYPSMRDGQVFNFWQDQRRVRGLWRRTSLESYLTDEIEWHTILDVDRLAREEDENWVYKGATCLWPDSSRCLVSLSDGGKDATVEREFDIEAGAFVEDGFVIPEAKSSVAWVDEDTLLVATDWGPESLTTSGYARTMRLWRRGEALEDAQLVVEIGAREVGVMPVAYVRPEGRVVGFIRFRSFFDSDYYILPRADDGALGEAVKLPLPGRPQVHDLFHGQVLFSPREDIEARVAGNGRAQRLPGGALLSASLEHMLETGELGPVRVAFTPDARTSLDSVGAGADVVYISVLDNVVGRIYRLTLDAEGWTKTALALPDSGTVSLVATDSFDNRAFANFSGFLTPSSLYHLDPSAEEEVIRVRSLPEQFKVDGLTVHQYEAASADGTQVPYFVVTTKNAAERGPMPTLLYGYGGFQISMSPFYSPTVGRLWLEEGGTFVLANIRGGGEFGPAWHQAALRENRQRAFDDFIAVAEDLIARGLTTPAQLGIMGGSNGGLLVGAAFTQRPELFGAVISQVPLLDMLRYNKLLAGASWMDEYGDPADPVMRAVISAYSPYHNVREGHQYPEVFLVTSTRDDRVHPAHARKMAARMEEFGHPVLYYENIEGGHSAAANLLQRAKRSALEYTYLARKLMGPVDENGGDGEEGEGGAGD